MNTRAIVSREARCGLRAIWVGEASHPGPASRRRRTQRLRALQRSMDSNGESDFDDDAMAGPTQVDSESASRVAARRLVIVSQNVPVVPPEIHAMTDSAGSDGGASSGFLDMFARDLDASEPMRTVPDTEEDLAPEQSDNDNVMSSRVGASEVDECSTLDHDSEIAVEAPIPTLPVGSQVSRHGFESMDLVNLLEIWKIRGNLMKSVPKFLLGVYRLAMRQALEAVCVGEARGDVLMQTRAWKFFFLVPRMFLFRPSRGGQVPKKALLTRVDLFNSGQWSELVEMSMTSSLDVANAQARRRRGTQRDTVEKRALRAFHMVQLGEVSAGRQALEGASLATGDERTLRALKDPAPCFAQESHARGDCSVQSRRTFRAGSRVVREERSNSEEGSRTRTIQHDRGPLQTSGGACVTFLSFRPSSSSVGPEQGPGRSHGRSAVR